MWLRKHHSQKKEEEMRKPEKIKFFFVAWHLLQIIKLYSKWCEKLLKVGVNIKIYVRYYICTKYQIIHGVYLYNYTWITKPV